MGTWTTAVKTWASGALTSTDMNAQIKDFANGFGAWTSYTPTWTSSPTAPVLGNGSLAGSYCQIQKFVYFRIKLTMGSTTTYGGGSTWTFTLPVTAAASYVTPEAVGTWSGNPASARSNGVLVISTTATVFMSIGGASTTVSQVTPGTWANGNVLSVSGFYEAA